MKLRVSSRMYFKEIAFYQKDKTPTSTGGGEFNEKGINRHDVENEYREWVRSDANSKGE